MTEDFYDLLEIPPDASQDEIKDAYRDQVRVYHPDLNDDDRAQAQFTAVKTAYDILGDPVERQAYDRLGHEDYVAKRTSGLPSPDVWKSDDEAEDDSSGTELSYSESETASAEASTASSSSAGSAASSSASAGRSSSTADSSGTTSTAGTTSASAGTTSGASSTASTGTGTGTGSGTGSAGSNGSGTRSRTGGTSGGSARGTARSGRTATGSGSETADTAGNPLTRWWRRQNFSLPLIWLSVLVYAAGIGHFGLENQDALSSLWAEIQSIGANPSGLSTLLLESRHGLETTLAFVQGVEFVAPPLETTLWYGALAGVVALALVGLLVVRAVTRANTWGRLTINETIVVALAVGATTTLVGGPLLAGAVLMPLLFGVIVRWTRRGPGWKPSYGYVLPVLAPLVGFGIAAAGVASLPTDLAAFVILPLAGALGLPLRATIRKHFDR
ncbi:DnaJ domain-containing protein [Natrinema versiforme]|uniref:Chaperone protein DnaJ n=1 Tax=Natrinema versiforme JCM 10478 TaxID=1227496 RepID=L9XT36_9EURY|nr:DnaJ domain-containing protein [Natrinema versiforme]ELY64526.1 chaperone protein DnaJ [Natrinema versiforme JCM 10478]